MTQKQIDTLKELGFKRKNNNEYYKTINTRILGRFLIIVRFDLVHITKSEILIRTHHLTLTKLREIVTKLEKL